MVVVFCLKVRWSVFSVDGILAVDIVNRYEIAFNSRNSSEAMTKAIFTLLKQTQKHIDRSFA
ncbi:hypothetical protein [Accumulibacter sp.]|uniref:hypothetical protein n=1 Tax=Accumulibacter sp. TaxID=2053492 RepID=UPI0025F888D6|nr:hypothetical protein [Accumulibacter sp.]MCP5229845.1 hypothetical protein [Accumulibacter sp.]